MIDIEKIKKYVVEQCEDELEYEDIVNERTMEVDYEAIIDFVIGLFMKGALK